MRKAAQHGVWYESPERAPFKRNDLMLNALPIGVVVFPGSGIRANLADKARKLGIPVWTFDACGAYTQNAPATANEMERVGQPA